jgi:hypothetical protein
MNGIVASFVRHFLVLVLASTAAMFTGGAKADEITFELRIERGLVAPDKRLIRVQQGDVVTLRWSTDRPMILHLHGYDIETKAEPGAVAEMNFTARATGRFPVSIHRPEQGGGHTHEAPVVQVEVHPR